jgi:hypothetical protein
VGNGGLGGDKDALYFSAGLDGETHGLFGSLRVAAGPMAAAAASARTSGAASTAALLASPGGPNTGAIIAATSAATLQQTSSGTAVVQHSMAARPHTPLVHGGRMHVSAPSTAHHKAFHTLGTLPTGDILAHAG